MEKKRVKNSTVLFFGILLIAFGFVIALSDYFIEKKEKAFTEMNLLLYENEIPDNIESEETLIEKIQDDIPKADDPEDKNEFQETKYDYIGILEIPKINLKRGFLDPSSIYNNVDYNITVINGSTFPTQKNGNLILAAHSGYCSICFFNQLYRVSLGDEAYISYSGVKYYYRVAKIYNVPKTGKVAIYRNEMKSTLTLITCTRNSDTEQTVYILELYNTENI